MEAILDNEFDREMRKDFSKIVGERIVDEKGFVLGNALESASVASSAEARPESDIKAVSFQETKSQPLSSYKLPVKLLSINQADDLSVISDDENM